MKVLLVEDEQSMLFTLSNLLKHRGYEVIAANSAEQGRIDIPEYFPEYSCIYWGD